MFGFTSFECLFSVIPFVVTITNIVDCLSGAKIHIYFYYSKNKSAVFKEYRKRLTFSYENESANYILVIVDFVSFLSFETKFIVTLVCMESDGCDGC